MGVILGGLGGENLGDGDFNIMIIMQKRLSRFEVWFYLQKSDNNNRKYLDKKTQKTDNVYISFDVLYRNTIYAGRKYSIDMRDNGKAFNTWGWLMAGSVKPLL